MEEGHGKTDEQAEAEGVADTEPLSEAELAEIARVEAELEAAKQAKVDMRQGNRGAAVVAVYSLCVSYGIPKDQALRYARGQIKTLVAALQKGRTG